MPSFTPKSRGAMSAAERQRKCRANGGGKHRGQRIRWTAEQKAQHEREIAAMMAYYEAEDHYLVAASAGADPIPTPVYPADMPRIEGFTDLFASAATSSPLIAAPIVAKPAFDWTLSAMAA